MPWTPLDFGKHSGLTLPQVLFKDPDWFFWAMENGVFLKRGTHQEAKTICLSSKKIKIPDKYQGRIAQYVVHTPTGKFQEMILIESTAHQTESAYYRNCIDLSIPRQLAPYDKSGCKLLIRSVKFYLFDNQKHVMTARRCEDFFDDPTNFL